MLLRDVTLQYQWSWRYNTNDRLSIYVCAVNINFLIALYCTRNNAIKKKYVAFIFSSGGGVMTIHTMLYLQGGKGRPYAVFLYARHVLVKKNFHSEPFSNIF